MGNKSMKQNMMVDVDNNQIFMELRNEGKPSSAMAVFDQLKVFHYIVQTS